MFCFLLGILFFPLILPFLILKMVVRLVFGLLMIPFVLMAIVFAVVASLIGVLFAVTFPLLPFALIGLAILALMRHSRAANVYPS